MAAPIRLAALCLCAAASSGCMTAHVLSLGAASVAGSIRPTLETDWEKTPEYSVYAWHQGAPLIPEKTKDYVHKGAERFTANGKVTAHTRASLQTIAAPFLAGLPNLARYRIPGVTFDKQPRYFIDKRLIMVSVDPAVLLLVPARFDDRDGKPLPPGSALDLRSGYNEVLSAYNRRMEQEFKAGIKAWIATPPNWYNYVEFSAVVPQVEGIEAIAPWRSGPVPLARALADPRWGFQAAPSQAFPGYLELRPRP